MTAPRDPEELLQQALRAQAVGGRSAAPAPMSASMSAPPREPTPGGLILLIALALGLLCGAVAGLVTVL